ncbi:MAG TPA: hypothetical protein QF487_06370 [Acidimicrobiales bacterium]|nr:hypothetical protein [Acidimicrobiales bacterium]
MTSKEIFVAPREIHDLIQRASRVKGCEASVAERIASKITFCEVNYGGGINGWLQLVNDDEHCLTETFKSVQVLDSIPSKDSLDFSWNPSIPFAFIAQSLNALQSYGFAWECNPEAPTGNVQIECVCLNKLDSEEIASNNKMNKAFSEGLQVDKGEWENLVGISSRFLLSEKILDDADSAVYE